jgi:acyl carrier protein
MHRGDSDLVAELRELIVRAAPDPARAEPVRRCRADDPLDEVIPFSSVIVLGTIVAVEDRFGIRVTRADLSRALAGGVTLGKLAAMVEELSGGSRDAGCT